MLAWYIYISILSEHVFDVKRMATIWGCGLTLQ